VPLTPGAASKVLWQEMLRHELLDAGARGAVVIVPVGSIEQHGLHLPLDVDISAPYHQAVRAAVRFADLPVLVAPPLTLDVAITRRGNRGLLASDWRHFWRSSAMWHEASGRTDSIASSSSTVTAEISTRWVRRR
jgi:hypothetical protein